MSSITNEELERHYTQLQELCKDETKIIEELEQLKEKHNKIHNAFNYACMVYQKALWSTLAENLRARLPRELRNEVYFWLWNVPDVLYEYHLQQVNPRYRGPLIWIDPDIMGQQIAAESLGWMYQSNLKHVKLRSRLLDRFVKRDDRIVGVAPAPYVETMHLRGFPGSNGLQSFTKLRELKVSTTRYECGIGEPEGWVNLKEQLDGFRPAYEWLTDKKRRCAVSIEVIDNKGRVVLSELEKYYSTPLDVWRESVTSFLGE